MMIDVRVNGDAAAEPWTYAARRLRTCGRVISLAKDKLAALIDLADGFAGDVREGFLHHADVADRLFEVADAYGIIADHGDDRVQAAIAEGLERADKPLDAVWARPTQPIRPNTTKVTISTAAALRTKVFEPIKFVVPGYIADGCTILAGRPKLGKSWLMLDISLAVAAGRYCLGETKCDQGDALYIAMEDNERRLQSRITKILGYSEDWPKQFHFATEWPKADAGGPDQIRSWIKSAERPRLIVVDVLAMFRSPRGAKDTFYESDYNAVHGLQSIASETGTAVVIVHHLRKSTAEVDPFEKVSGTLGLSGAADTALILDRAGQGTTLYGRGRDIEEIETAVQFNKDTCRWTILGNASDIHRSSERGRILAALDEAGDVVSPQEIAATTGMSPTNVWQMLHRMATDGEVVRVGRGKYRRADADPNPLSGVSGSQED